MFRLPTLHFGFDFTSVDEKRIFRTSGQDFKCVKKINKKGLQKNVYVSGISREKLDICRAET